MLALAERANQVQELLVAAPGRQLQVLPARRRAWTFERRPRLEGTPCPLRRHASRRSRAVARQCGVVSTEGSEQRVAQVWSKPGHVESLGVCRTRWQLCRSLVALIVWRKGSGMSRLLAGRRIKPLNRDSEIQI